MKGDLIAVNYWQSAAISLLSSSLCTITLSRYSAKLNLRGRCSVIK